MNRFISVTVSVCLLAAIINFSSIYVEASDVRQIISGANEDLGYNLFHETLGGKSINLKYLDFTVTGFDPAHLLVYGDESDASNSAVSLGMTPAWKNGMPRALGYTVKGLPFPNPNFPSDYSEGSGNSNTSWYTASELNNSPRSSKATINAWLGPVSGGRGDNLLSDIRPGTLIPENLVGLLLQLQRRADPTRTPVGSTHYINLADIAWVLQPPTNNTWGLVIFFHDVPGTGSGTLYTTALIKPYSLQANAGNDLSAYVRNLVSSAKPETEIKLDFVVHSSFSGEVDTEYAITGIGETKTGEFKIKSEEEIVIPYTFTMPDGNVTITFEVNPTGLKPKEDDRSNNKVEVDVSAVKPVEVQGDIQLFFDELKKTVQFGLGASSASLSLPSGLRNPQWAPGSRTTGSFTVINETPVDGSPPDIYDDFSVEMNGIWRNGNSITIPIDSSATTIQMNGTIRTTIERYSASDYMDDPPNEYGANDVDIKNTGRITANGSISREYRYRPHSSHPRPYPSTGSTPCTCWEYGTAHADFSEVINEKNVVVRVYNGRETVPPQTHFLKRIDSNTYLSSKKKLWWVSKPIIIDVVRFMHDRGLSGPPFSSGPKLNERPVDGQYERSFIEQNYADIEWTIEESGKMETAYKDDRVKAINRDYDVRERGVVGARAVFASDKALNRGSTYDIRSGYYFNPAGIYSFKVVTEVYKYWHPPNNTPTPEHAVFVKALLESFYYESDMVYINPSKDAVTIAGEPAGRVGPTYTPSPDRVRITHFNGFNNYDAYDVEFTPGNSPFFEIAADNTRFEQEVEELLHGYSPLYADVRLRRVMEGHPESGTINNKNYVEYVHEDEEVYRIKETTEVTIRVNPVNRRVYTHVEMRNGSYSVGTYMNNISISGLTYVDIDDEEYPLTGNHLNIPLRGTELNMIEINVVGSMYDDI